MAGLGASTVRAGISFLEDGVSLSDNSKRQVLFQAKKKSKNKVFHIHPNELKCPKQMCQSVASSFSLKRWSVNLIDVFVDLLFITQMADVEDHFWEPITQVLKGPFSRPRGSQTLQW